MNIREALPQDASAICQLLRNSITALCVADHKNDPVILGRWLENKTPETLTAWIVDPDSTMLVAVEGTAILAVGSIMRDGEISLNYVDPAARFKGISRAMIMALEATALKQGNTRCTLFSTGTARRFYLALGYTEESTEVGLSGAPTYPMFKDIPLT